MSKSLIVFLLGSLVALISEAQQKPVVKTTSIEQICFEQLKKFPGVSDERLLKEACAQAQVMDGCLSVKGTPIYHYDRLSTDAKAKRILVFSLIHGDETHAGTVGRYWMERLGAIDPRNSWRVIPVLNPDGVQAKTRTNGNNIDINRNFPTKDWNDLAKTYWEKRTSANPRRFPGNEAGSEPETKCALNQIADYKPDFIVSVHTPLDVLDFDGPKVKPPKYDYLPWRSLGHYPGSLGRYMWFERQTPVLTMELKGTLPRSHAPFEQLQDVIGSLVKLEIKRTHSELSEPYLPTSASNRDH